MPIRKYKLYSTSTSNIYYVCIILYIIIILLYCVTSNLKLSTTKYITDYGLGCHTLERLAIKYR